VLPTDIYTLNFKILLYFQSAWYIIFSIYEKCGIFLSGVLFETLNQSIGYIAKPKQRNHGDFKAVYKKFNDCALHGSKLALWLSGKRDWRRADKF